MKISSTRLLVIAGVLICFKQAHSIPSVFLKKPASTIVAEKKKFNLEKPLASYRMLSPDEQKKVKQALRLILDTFEDALKKAVDLALSLEEIQKNTELYSSDKALDALDSAVETLKPILDIINALFKKIEEIKEKKNILSKDAQKALNAMLKAVTPSFDNKHIKGDPQAFVLNSIAMLRSNLQALYNQL